jgi:hypothetical protein
MKTSIHNKKLLWNEEETTGWSVTQQQSVSNNPEQQVMQQQFTSPIPPYQFQQTSHKMMPLEQTTINRTLSTSNNKNNTQDEPEIRTNYTWQFN